MSLTVTQIIGIIAPQFSADSDLANTISLVELRTSSDAFGVKYNYAVALRAAHILTLRDMNSISSGGILAGNVTSMSEGNTSISFGGSSSNSDNSDLNLTRYGMELLGLIRGNILGFSISNYSTARTNLLSDDEEE